MEDKILINSQPDVKALILEMSESKPFNTLKFLINQMPSQVERNLLMLEPGWAVDFLKNLKDNHQRDQFIDFLIENKFDFYSFYKAPSSYYWGHKAENPRQVFYTLIEHVSDETSAKIYEHVHNIIPDIFSLSENKNIYPLHKAYEKRKIKTAEKLHQLYNFDLNKKDEKGYTIEHYSRDFPALVELYSKEKNLDSFEPLFRWFENQMNNLVKITDRNFEIDNFINTKFNSFNRLEQETFLAASVGSKTNYYFKKILKTMGYNRLKDYKAQYVQPWSQLHKCKNASMIEDFIKHGHSLFDFCATSKKTFLEALFSSYLNNYQRTTNNKIKDLLKSTQQDFFEHCIKPLDNKILSQLQERKEDGVITNLYPSPNHTNFSLLTYSHLGEKAGEDYYRYYLDKMFNNHDLNKIFFEPKDNWPEDMLDKHINLLGKTWFADSVFSNSVPSFEKNKSVFLSNAQYVLTYNPTYFHVSSGQLFRHHLDCFEHAQQINPDKKIEKAFVSQYFDLLKSMSNEISFLSLRENNVAYDLIIKVAEYCADEPTLDWTGFTEHLNKISEKPISSDAKNLCSILYNYGLSHSLKEKNMNLKKMKL